MTHPIIILGSGYTGRHVAGSLTATSRPFFATSREPNKNLSDLPMDRRMKFDLARQNTWAKIAADADLLWCFPAEPLEQVRNFATAINLSSHRFVLLGSTSAYEVSDRLSEYPPPWIDETAQINLSKRRVQGEEFLRGDCGAIVLRVAGIYGHGRNPLDWIRQGRVGPSQKFVNLIHVEDLAAICLLALSKGNPGEAYNISDGIPRTWGEICATAQQRWGVAPSAAKEDPSSGKRISNAKLRSELGYRFRHSDLYEALDLIESTQSES
jgi:nucleoside-diphosphate-sugar epimerase